jgi:hypothetical protein
MYKTAMENYSVESWSPQTNLLLKNKGQVAPFPEHRHTGVMVVELYAF